MESINVDIEDFIKDDSDKATAFHKINTDMKHSKKEPFVPPCGWFMKKGKCPFYQKKNNENDNEERKTKVAKIEQEEVSKEDWVTTIRSCTTERNYGMNSLDSSFHTTPTGYSQRKEKYAKHYKPLQSNKRKKEH
jgi:hypothetical protein